MIAFPDTSFLRALYRQQTNSPAAIAHAKAMPEALHVSSLLLYEFRQSLRFQAWLHSNDSKRGFPAKEGARALAILESNIESGALAIVPADWPEVHKLAEGLSRAHTQASGCRSMDTLHIATALHLGAREFLSFDERQRKLASAEGLKAKP